LSDDHWQRNVETAIRLQIPHLSCYALTVEPRTALDQLIRQHKRADVNSDDQARQLLLLMDWMSQSGYDHYEISNFALPGHRSRHNSSYWQGRPYLGLGPSAHSFDGESRQWNISNNARYVSILANEELPVADREVLTGIQQLNEYIMVSLRTMDGLDFHHIKNRFGEQSAQEIIKKIGRYVLEGKAVMMEDRVFLTSQGKLLADRITADLFMA
jgi:oxygen-independent coproporphyrinogen-3 oxidase